MIDSDEAARMIRRGEWLLRLGFLEEYRQTVVYRWAAAGASEYATALTERDEPSAEAILQYCVDISDQHTDASLLDP